MKNTKFIKNLQNHYNNKLDSLLIYMLLANHTVRSPVVFPIANAAYLLSSAVTKKIRK